MKRAALIVALVGLAIPASATADNGRPSVHKDTAERRSASLLNSKIPSWRHRQFGFIDCNGGRINRFTWVCRVAWGSGHSCHRGRVRVTGVERRATSNLFDVHFRGTGTYSCQGTG